MIKVLAYVRYFPVVFLLFSSSSELKDIIKEDYRQTKHKNFLDAFRADAGFRNIFYARVKHGILWRICTWIARPYPQIEVAVNDGIGKGLVIYHNSGVTINAKSIGEYCYIYQGVTIGKGKETKIGKRPVIGNNVRICTNSVVLGGITIGDHAVIGASSFVNRDVPSRAVVGGGTG